jgi:DNA-directed RNA polymerase specialized sigma24 family protein
VPEPTTAPTDDDLLSAIGAGDAAAFARWLAGAEDRLRGSLRSFAELADVEAILQETLVRVWQVAPRVVPDGRPHALLRLAIRIGRNLAVSALRQRRLEPVEAAALERLAAETETFTPGPDRWRDPMLRRAIDDCRRRLPARPARALEARLDSAGAEPDVRLAERLGMRPNTFLQNVVRARRFLADCLRKRGIDLALEMS